MRKILFGSGFSVLLALLVFFIFVFHGDGRTGGLSRVRQWFILLNYDSSRFPADPNALKKYDLAILDPDNHPPFEVFDPSAILIGYISVGEAGSYRSYWPSVKNEPWVVGPNENWQGDYYVDVRSPKWQSLIVDQVVPAVAAKGFKGIFLDTLDTAEYLETKSPKDFSGSQDAMAGLVRVIHEKYPGLFLISNNGFHLLDRLAPSLSGLLAEDIFMMPDFAAKGYKPVPEEERAEKIRILSRVSKRYRLPVFNVDYASKTDTALRRWCSKESRRLGWLPYVAEKDLSEIYPP